jgi:ribonuclease-3
MRMPRRSARSRTPSTTSTSTARPDPCGRRSGRRSAIAISAAATDTPARRLAEHLGLPFRDLSRLQEALTHSSYANEHPELALSHNERLEFLGDAVLSLIVSEALMKRHPGEHEGQLTTRRAAIVSASGLSQIASRLDLGSYLILGEGASRSGERRRDSVLASLFEAVVAATFLDCGLARTRRFVVTAAKPELEATGGVTRLKAPKSRLQEHAYRRSGRPPVYRVVSAEGPDHRRHYVVEVSLDGQTLGRGEGPNRRIAETEAATDALDRVETLGEPPVADHSATSRRR